MSFQATITNRTPFKVENFVLPTPEGQEAVLTIANGSYNILRGEGLRLAQIQRLTTIADEFYGDPESSSTYCDSQLVLFKPSVDLLVVGHIYAPGGRPCERCWASIRVGPLLKTIRASGDRIWIHGPFGRKPSSPLPFDRLALVYERAFGGAAAHRVYASNPVGVGYNGAHAHDPNIATEIPNFEYSGEEQLSPLDRITPASFGPVGRAWEPRRRFAGTYDERWLKERWPLLPSDFDSRYNQSAPQDQQTEDLQGGEAVTLTGLCPEGVAQFYIPRMHVVIKYFYQRETVANMLRLDTVLIEPDKSSVTFTWRAAMITKRRRGMLREILVYTGS